MCHTPKLTVGKYQQTAYQYCLTMHAYPTAHNTSEVHTCCFASPNCLFIDVLRRSQWPRCLRCGSAAARHICEFEYRRGHGCLFVVSVVCCQVEVSASGWSLVQRSPTECGVSECDHEASIMRRLRPTSACCAMRNNWINVLNVIRGLEL